MLSLCPRLETPPSPAGLDTNPDRPDDKLPYRGAWLWIGPEMIHLMELPNPDPTERAKRPGEGRWVALTRCISTPIGLPLYMFGALGSTVHALIHHVASVLLPQDVVTPLCSRTCIRSTRHQTCLPYWS
jgi:hypothetical protein